MYNLIYTVPFVNVDGESFTIQILEDGGTGSPTELVGGTPPFVVDMNDEDFLYTPTRFSGATLKLVGSDYLQRLFSTQYQKFKVNLLKGSTIIWTGFITPEVYSQDYDNELFELEIECISALSTLEYIDSDFTGGTVTLLDIIEDCITKSNGNFNAVYVPNTYTTALSSISVSAANFVDEDGKAMTLKECLEEVCKFLNWTVTEYNGNVYFIDVDYIVAGKTSYTNILNNTSQTLSSSITLQNIASKGSDNTLSILGGYNKAVVIDSDYEADVDKLYPEWEWQADGSISSKAINVNSTTYQKFWGFSSPDFTFTHYTYNNGVWSTTASNNIDYAGAFPIKTTSYSSEDIPNSLSYTNEIEIHELDHNDGDVIVGETDENIFLFHDDVLRKVLELSDSFGSVIIVDDDYKFAINFQIARCTVSDRLIYPVTNESEDVEARELHVPFKFQIGDYYYNGTSWQASECTFNVPVTIRYNQLCNTYVSCNDTNDFLTGYDKLNGYLINVDRTLYGVPKLTMYNPLNDKLSAFYETNARSYFIKELELNCQKQGNMNLIGNDDEKEDTKYENVVNDEYINECDDITFKITSKNDSELSYSKAFVSGGILDTMKNNIYNTDEKPEKLMIQRIVNQYNQPKIKLIQVIKPDILPYSIVTDNYLSGKKFLFTGGTIDYEDNRINCNLIEVK